LKRGAIVSLDLSKSDGTGIKGQNTVQVCRVKSESVIDWILTNVFISEITSYDILKVKIPFIGTGDTTIL
jgi:hypothetical protein